MSYSNGYIIGFAAAVCVVCSVFVSGSAVLLKDRQITNKLLDRQKNVLSVSGLVDDANSMSSTEVDSLFSEGIRARIVELETGKYVDEVAGMDASSYDQQRALRDPELSVPAPSNRAKVLTLPKYALVYEVIEDGKVSSIILPVEGKGLWSTLYGFLALDDDTRTINGLTFYQHAETPGLGGEVDNPRWKAKWVGKKAFDDQWEPAVAVVKGTSRDPEYGVDGLSGATLTSRGVTNLVQFWLGEDGFGPYLKNFRNGGV